MSSPTVSVIIPVYNDPDGIELTLESVTGQTYSTDEYEVLAVDNDSTDHTPAVIERYADRYAHVHALAKHDIQSPAAARNMGIEHANGNILVFIDADMTVQADWLESAVAALEAGDHDYMGYAVDSYPPDGRRTLGTEHDRLYAFPTADHIRDSGYAGTGCLLVRRPVIDAVGDFDPRLVSSEDEEFGTRVRAAGFDQHFEPTLTVYHPARSSVAAQLRRHVRLGRGHRQLCDYYPDRFDATSPFALRRWLPLHPERFRDDLTRRGGTVSRRMAVGLWSLGSLAKLARTAGEAYEWATMRR